MRVVLPQRRGLLGRTRGSMDLTCAERYPGRAEQHEGECSENFPMHER
jgi:hypothetical protein